ncbi:MAG: DUF2306 domain-containing protein [Afipia sp.]|nr:DUF2306 domain-containing protein [Afipia sp.]
MNFAPLLNAPWIVQLHAFAAMGALALGAVQFTAKKGTLPHRTIGWIWVVLMTTVATASFWIHGRNAAPFGVWSPIHYLSIFSLVMLPLAVWAAHRHKVRSHMIRMISIYTGGLVIAGLFTLVPGRIMHAVVFGP